MTKSPSKVPNGTEVGDTAMSQPDSKGFGWFRSLGSRWQMQFYVEKVKAISLGTISLGTFYQPNVCCSADMKCDIYKAAP